MMNMTFIVLLLRLHLYVHIISPSLYEIFEIRGPAGQCSPVPWTALLAALAYLRYVCLINYFVTCSISLLYII